MKLLHLLLALALPASAWATTRTVTLNPPAQVYAGQAFLMSASASTSATDSEQIGFFHGLYSYDNGASWHWFTSNENIGKSATRNGWINTGAAYSTILVMVKVAFRGGAAGDVDYNGNPINWSGSWGSNQSPPAKFVTITVQPPPNQPPTVTWVQAPSSAWINQWFPIQARANDSNGNLSNLWVWREWVPHAFGGGGNNWEAYSDPNLASRSSAGTLTFQAQSADSSGAYSPVIYHTVTVPNRDPSISIQILNESQSPITLNGNGRAPVPIGKPFYIRINGSDPDARLSRFYSRLNRPDGSPEAYPEQPVSGGSAAHNFGPYMADAGNEIGVWDVWGHVVDADAGGYQWQGNGWAGSHAPDVEVYNTSPHSLSLTPSGPTLQWNATYGHYTMWTNNTLTVTANLQDADGNLTGHTLRYQNVTGSGPVEANWIVVNGSAPSNTGNSTKQVALNLTPGRWDFNTFGGDWTFQLPGQSITVWVYGPENGAQFVSQSVPTTMTTGDSFQVSITMRNSGNNPWTTDATPHRLGSQNPTDTNRWGVTRVPLAAGETIVPTAQKTFTFNVTAPTTPGAHNFQWQMLEEGVVNPWFGPLTPNLVINVTDNDPPSAPTGLVATNVTPYTFTLSWNASTDNAGVTLYEIERQGFGTVSTSGLSYNFTGLTHNTTYQVRVVARDAAGNGSASGWLTVPTPADPNADDDGDGLTNQQEQILGTNPSVANPADTNNTNNLKVHRPRQ